MAVARENAGLAHPQKVDVIALARIQNERLEPHVLGLRHPVRIVGKPIGEDACVDDIAHHPSRLRKLIGHFALIRAAH
jgi:hypothetical protein